MKLRYVSLALAGATTLAACADQATAPVAPTSTRAAFATGLASVSGNYLVRFASNDVPAGFAARVATLGGQVMFAHSGAGVAAVSGLSLSAANQLAASSGVQAVDADAGVALELPTIDAVEAADAPDATIESQANPAAAARYGRQWNMRQVAANVAWAQGKLGSASTKVGIIDTGIDYTYMDLDGLVNLSLSKSYLPDDDALVQQKFPGAHPIADLVFHGTHVASTVASEGIVVAGVTSKVTLVGYKVCSYITGFCPSSATFQAILDAADAGIDVVNMSLGGHFLRVEASARGGNGPSYLASINRVVNYANRKGMTIVVSAGNSAIDLDADANGYASYCDAPQVICVAATGPTAARLVATAQYPAPGGTYLLTNPDAPAPYSNFGGSIDVAAPGGAAAPVWADCSHFAQGGLAICQTGNFIVGASGTSMASPHVTGLAALLVGELGRKPGAIRDLIAASADDLGPAGADPHYGSGRINVGRAVSMIP